MAQWIRHRPTEPGIVCSSPTGVMFLRSSCTMHEANMDPLIPHMQLGWFRFLRKTLAFFVNQNWMGDSWKVEFINCEGVRASAGGLVNYSSTARGFEPLRAEPNGFRVHHLSHSVTLSVNKCMDKSNTLYSTPNSFSLTCWQLRKWEFVKHREVGTT